MGDNALRICIRLAQPAFCAFFVLGAAYSVSAQEPPNLQKDPKAYSCCTPGHYCSSGGAYGIGKGWSIEIVPPEYGTVSETVMDTSRPPVPAFPATYEWIEEQSEFLKDNSSLTTKSYTIIPAEYETKIVTEIIEYARTEYFLTDAKYNQDGTVKTPRVVKERRIPAITKDDMQQILKTPEQIAERISPVVRREGFVRVLKTPAQPGRPAYPVTKTIPRTIVKQPAKFLIKSPSGGTSESFLKYENLTDFVEMCKSDIFGQGE